MANKTDLEILSEMTKGAKDIKASTKVMEQRSLTNGGVVTMAVDDITIRNLQLGKNHKVILYVVNKNEFNIIKNSK